MPITADHDLTRPQQILDDRTQQVFWACNCINQPANRRLAYVNANRSLFSVWPPKPAAQPGAQK